MLYNAQWASPLLLLGRSHLNRFIQIFLKFTKIYDKILKIFAQKLTRPELGKGVKVPSRVKDKQLKEVTKQNCQKVTTESIFSSVWVTR